MRRSALAVATLAFAAAGCHKTTSTPPPVTQPKVNRCDTDLSAYTQLAGTGASATAITSAGQLIGGEAAAGRLGDTLMANDKIRVIVQQPGRVVGPDPYGGALIDADFVGTTGNDKFGKLAPFFHFGRTVNVSAVEIIAGGGQGGPAIVAATGTDTVDDYINVKSQVGQVLGAGLNLQIDPDPDLGLRITTYYVLAPGQTHVSIVTAFCNDADDSIVTTAGDLIDSGGDVAVMNPQSKTGGLGYTSNPDGMTWLGWMANDDSIAYGVAPWKLNDLSTPETHSNALTIAGVSGYLIGNKGGLDGLTEWITPNARNRSGTLIIPPKGSVRIGREFVVGKDLGEVAATVESVRAAKTGAQLVTYAGTVTDGAGPVAGARVAIERPDADGFNPTMQEALLLTDANGAFSLALPKDSYTFTAYQLGRNPSAKVTVASDATNTSGIALTVDARHALTVSVADEAGHALPAKVTVRCAGGPCATTPAKLVRFEDFPADSRPDDIQLVGYVTPSGSETFYVPGGAYQVLVSYGPEYTIYPATGPATGAAVDLTGAGSTATVHAVLSKVVDTSGWLSADFHVHCVNSPDSPVAIVDRAKTFLAEDVNVLTATDHDFITDYAPTNHALGGDGFMATMIGEEITTFDYGHFNPWPIRLDASDPVTHGAFDWGNGADLSFQIDDIIKHARSDLGAKTFQINHPNGSMSTFGGILLDANTLKTHAPASQFRMQPSPRATADDTGLFPKEKWDAMEVMNGFSRSSFDGLLNNWMTFTANGLAVTGTAVSDTHHKWSAAGGYPRSYVRMGAGHDSVATFDANLMSDAVNAHRVVGSLGLFVKAYAFKTGTTYDLANLEGACDAAGAACARIGDTLPTDATGFDLVVDVQSPEWIKFDEISIFNHGAARFMLNGQPDSDFAPEHAPTAGYAHRSVTLDASTREVVHTANGLGCAADPCEAARWHAQAVFHVASGGDLPVPGGDDFFFVVVRDSNQGRDLMPLVYDGVVNDSGAMSYAPAHAFAFTNAIFVDRDGNGYDHPPGLPSPANPPMKPAPHVLSGSLAWRLHEMLREIAAE